MGSGNDRQNILSALWKTIAGKVNSAGHPRADDRGPTTADDLQWPAMMGSLIGAGVVAAAGAAAYQAMAPSAQGYGRTFASGPRGSKRIALTYDDGPNDPHTYRLLEVLEKHGVRATFFLIGRHVEQRPAIVREIVKGGHAIGNHTFTHPNLAVASVVQNRIQMEECQRAILEVTGETPRLFRPPYGGRRPATLKIARSLGLEPIMWNVTSFDWQVPPAEKIVKTCVRQMRGGDVILMHDGSHRAFGADRAQTALATGMLLERYRAAGCEFVTVPEMMGTAPVVGLRSSVVG
jgi:peptidoglycan/xylan/chitin deacetylase (PgdA/CDA1 family)